MEVVGPFDAAFDVAEVVDALAEVDAHPEGEGGELCRGDARAEGEAGVNVSVFRAVPDASETTAAGGLLATEDDEGGLCSVGELAFGFGVGAVDFVEDDDVKVRGGARQEGFDHGGVEGVWFLQEAVPFAADGFEFKALGAHLLHMRPDGYARYFESVGEDAA